MPDSSTNDLRRHLIKQRLQLNPREIQLHSQFILNKIVSLPVFMRSQRIAIYLPTKGEVDISAIFGRAKLMRKTCFLPVLHPLKHNRLLFIAYEPGDTLVANRYGILEPVVDSTKIVPAWSLDLVITPLVGFDSKMMRLGMGGGFYDRTFGFTLQQKFQHRPILMGVGYEFQKLSNLPSRSWDVPLNLVITEQGIYE